MANTFSQIYIQTVFAVGARQSLIKPEFKRDLHKYIAGIVRNQGQKLISIKVIRNSMQLFVTFKIRRNITREVRSGVNT